MTSSGALELAFATGRPFTGLRGHTRDPALDALVPPDLARRLRVVPLAADAGRLRLACPNPEPDLEPLRERAGGRSIEVVLADAAEVDDVLGPAAAEDDAEGPGDEEAAEPGRPGRAAPPAHQQRPHLAPPSPRPRAREDRSAPRPALGAAQRPAGAVARGAPPRWPLLVAALPALVAAALLVLLLPADDHASPQTTAAATTMSRRPAAPPRVAVAGLEPDDVERVLAPGTTRTAAADRAGALAAVCSGRAGAALLDGPPTGAEQAAACATAVAGDVALSATGLVARGGGCADGATAQRLAGEPAGRLDARRRLVGGAVSRRTKGPRAQRRAAVAAALARFDARRRLRPLAVRDAAGACVAASPDAIATGAYPLQVRATLVTQPDGAAATASALRPPPRPRVGTVALDRLPPA